MQYDYIVVDSHLQAYKNWWPCRELQDSTGNPTGLEFGFIKCILALARNYQPAKVVLAWDGFPQRCNTLFPFSKDAMTGEEAGYKSGRQKHKDHLDEPSWSPRLDALRNAFLHMCTTLYNLNTEADEEIARFVFWAEKQGKTTLIISKDKDLHQLVSDKTHLVKGVDEANIYTPEVVELEWGIIPSKISFRRAIEGDSSDHIPGIPRIPKLVINALAKDAISIDNLLELIETGCYCKSGTQLTKMLDGRDIIRRNYFLSELASQANFEPSFLSGTTGDTSAVMSLCLQFELKSLVSRKEWALFDGPVIF